MRYEGYNGVVEIVSDQLIISRPGRVAWVGHGKDVPPRTIPLQAVSGVDVRPATRTVNGYLRILLGGQTVPEPGSRHLGSDPDTILFTWRKREQFGQLHLWLTSVAARNVELGVDPSTVAVQASSGRLVERAQKAADRQERWSAAADQRQSRLREQAEQQRARAQKKVAQDEQREAERTARREQRQAEQRARLPRQDQPQQAAHEQVAAQPEGVVRPPLDAASNRPSRQSGQEAALAEACGPGLSERPRPDIAEVTVQMEGMFGGLRELKKLQEHVYASETVRYIAEGSCRSRMGIVALTDQRLLFVFHGIARRTVEEFPLDSITSVSSRSGLGVGTLIVHTAGRETLIGGVYRVDLAWLVEALRERAAAHEAKPDAAATSPAVVQPDPAQPDV